jgi:hypothetical protein
MIHPRRHADHAGTVVRRRSFRHVRAVTVAVCRIRIVVGEVVAQVGAVVRGKLRMGRVVPVSRTATGTPRR